MLFVQRIEVGTMGVNCMLIGCTETKDALIIDPGEDAPWILEEVDKGRWNVRYIVNTHGHYDHIGANAELKEKTGAQILIHAEDAPMLTDPNKNFSVFSGRGLINGPAADRFLKDGDIIEVGNSIKLKVIHTPGHTAGSIALYQDGHLFSGDTLFSYSIGRTDFPGGSYEAIMDSVKNKLLIYPDDTMVYPGHNSLATIGEIKVQNPYAQ